MEPFLQSDPFQQTMPDCDCLLKQAALDSPGDLALLSTDARLTFFELDSLTDQISLQLYRSGIQPGDRIGLLHRSSPFSIALFFAAWRHGASICPLNLRYPPSQIQACLHRLLPKLFIDRFPIQAKPMPTPKSAARSLFLFTSGSTGLPKIAVLSLENLIASASSFPVVALERNDRWLLSLPLFHVGGIGIVLRCILARATIVLDGRDDEITHISYVPTQLYRSIPLYKNLKCLLLGGASISFYPEKLSSYLTYGLTEMGSWVAARKHPPKIEGHFYLGHPLPGREVRISPEGEILVRGSTLFQGYWNQGESEPAPEWFGTRDLGRFDRKEGLAILGRKDWQFISGGENIQPEEIERYLLQIPEVLEAVVVGQKDREYGERPVAFICSSDPTFDLIQLQRQLFDRLPKYKIPVSLFHLENMPKNGLKTDRKALIEIANRNL